jgi:subtilase family serine protease
MSHSSWVDTHPPYAYVRPLFFLFALFQLPLFAQSAIRIVPDNAVASSVATPTVAVDENRITTLRGTVHVLARPRFDRGAVADDFPMRRMLVMLNRPSEREAARQLFLREVHTQSSPLFHKWASPQEYGQQFGAKDEDIQTVAAWLASHGLSVDRVTSSRTMIEFSGTAAQVSQALHVEIHQYAAAGRSFYANDREISVPQAIAARIRNFAPLNTFEPTSYVAPAGTAKVSRGSHGEAPTFTLTVNNAPFYALAPEDFATQYDLAPVYAAGTDGSGQTIGIIGTTNLNLTIVDAYRQLFNLSGDNTQVIMDGEDPGDGLAPNIEALLDVELSGAIAPNATVNFYVAGGQPFQDSLALAAMRAVEDDQASVISLSYGTCEPLLGAPGNQLWAGLWEQAAAQGQTVLVASGDTGPGACLGDILIDENGDEETFGLTANGLGSTPWNVSVGGSDFYYSDYATGGASIATLWNQTNDANLGSLKAPLPEQPWDSALGLNIIPSFQSLNGMMLLVGPVPSPAGGGASSNCAQETAFSATQLPSCIAGYAKPVWQQGTGVPNDGVRDLPDVSLFAANGPNLSAWAICAEPGDCAAGATSTVTLVGGTSTSTPAMAGIMALINQKYGRQGQADYTLYALAQQQSGIFHDITLGTNDVACVLGTPPPPFLPVPGCTDLYPNSIPDTYSFGLYAAATGYDLASGLGSFDANELISNWTKVALSPTSTTLKLSPTTVTHGTPIALTASVAAGSGSGTPVGDIVLQTNPPSPLRGNAPVPLANGSASANITTLPGGSYQVEAQYGGDGVFGPSNSSPVAVTITPEQSSTTVSGNYEYLVQLSGGQGPAEEIQTGTISNGGQVFFGSAITYLATPTGLTTNSSGLASGSATFTDGNLTATVPLSVNGVASWTPQSIAIGSHSVTVSYSGDASYSPSTGDPLSFTVAKGTPLLEAEILNLPPIVSCPPPPGGICSQSYLAGSSLVVHVLLSALNGNVPPSGSVTVTLGTLTQTVPVVADSYLNENLSTGYVTLSNVPAGTFTLSASYSGDSNWNATSYTAPQALTFVASTAVASSTTTLTASPNSVNSSGGVTFNVTVTASTDQYGTPVGLFELLANGTLFAGGIVGGSGIVTTSQTESGTVTVPAGLLPLGALNVTAVYLGSAGVESSVSAPVQLNVTASDFTFSAGAPSLTVQSGQIGTVSLLLTGPYGVGVPVTLACTPSSNQFGCSVNPASPTVNGSSSATLSITASVPNSAAGVAALRNADSKRWPAAACIFIFSLGAMLILPGSGRRLRTPTVILMLALLLFAPSCASNSSSSTPPPNSNPTPAGTYNVLVTATSGGVIHNLQVGVVVSGK